MIARAAFPTGLGLSLFIVCTHAMESKYEMHISRPPRTWEISCLRRDAGLVAAVGCKELVVLIRSTFQISAAVSINFVKLQMYEV